MFNRDIEHYVGNNPVKYVDPTGMWIDNGDGTHTAETGDTLWDLYGSEWEYKSDFEGDPTTLQPGDVVGQLNTTTVSVKGSGGGLYGAFIVGKGVQYDTSVYEVEFTIEETGESFTQTFRDISTSGTGLKVGIGAYTKDIEGTGIFTGTPPDKEDIINSFVGPSDVIGFSFLWFGINGYENKTWIVNSGGIGISLGADFSVGMEKSNTMLERK